MTVSAWVARAYHITANLRATGYPLAEARYVPEASAIVCNFPLVNAAPAWRVPFVLDPDEATAEEFVSLLGQWKARKCEDLVHNRAGPVLAGAIAAHSDAARQAIGAPPQ